MLQPNEPVISALRQDIVELRTELKKLREDLDLVNRSVQGAFEATTKTTGMSLRFLDARIDDLEKQISGSEEIDGTGTEGTSGDETP